MPTTKKMSRKRRKAVLANLKKARLARAAKRLEERDAFVQSVTQPTDEEIRKSIHQAAYKMGLEDGRRSDGGIREAKVRALQALATIADAAAHLAGDV